MPELLSEKYPDYSEYNYEDQKKSINEKVQSIIENFLDVECRTTIDVSESEAKNLRDFIKEQIAICIENALLKKMAEKGIVKGMRGVSVEELAATINNLAVVYKEEKNFKLSDIFESLGNELLSISTPKEKKLN